MAWYSIFVSVAGFLWSLFVDWIRTIFVLPFQNVDMLWLLVPVWIAWFVAEFFQEKVGTSMGNAISNAVVILWGSIDCARQTSYWMTKHANLVWEGVLRYLLVIVIFIYGGIIVWLGIKGNELIKYIGRIREITYVFVMFVPIFYGAISFSWNHIIGAILFFPLFYFVIEVFDRYTPDPKAITMDLNDLNQEKPKPVQPIMGLPSQQRPAQQPNNYSNQNYNNNNQNYNNQYRR